MKRLKLFERSEEIYNQLPKDYADIILNTILARSVENGNLLNEVKLYLTSADFEEFQKHFKGVEMPKQKKHTEKVFISKKKSKAEISEEEASKSFIL